MIALWIAHTWSLDAFDYSPYLNPFSPEKQCGKSRLLDCLELLSFRPWRTISPSEAVLFRHIDTEQPSLLLDEVDTVFGNVKSDRSEPLRALLNAGFERGASVPRCVGQGGNFTVQQFKVFCPKAFAGIGSLPDTIRSRCIPIRLNRKTRHERVERFRKREVGEEAKTLRARLETWGKDPAILNALRGARPSVPDQLSDRQADICEPLLAIAELAGGQWPDRSRNAIVEACTDASASEDESLSVKLLLAIRLSFDSADMDRLATADLLNDLMDRDTDAPWVNWWERELRDGNVRGPAAKLARLLKPFGIKPRVIRQPDNTTPRGFMRTDFVEAWDRYCAGAAPNATTQQGAETPA